MKNKHYLEEELTGLLPLLASIAREIEERTACLESIESALASSPFAEPGDGPPNLVAEAATHRRELRMARQELERLGCSVVGTTPLTFRIPGRVGEVNKSFVWQTGDLILK